MSDTINRNESLQKAIEAIEKNFGKGLIRRLGDAPESDQVNHCISTGSIGLDVALGIGGYPQGRIIEIYGPESSGKTTLALHAIAEAQKNGGNCVFIDVEHAFDPLYARNLGIDTDNLYVSQPDTGEQALSIAEMMLRSEAISVLVIDSVAALVPKAELEGEVGDSHMGLQARLMGQGLRKITGITKKTDCVVIFINQTRQKIGVIFGNPETTTGGNALKFFASVRLEVRKVGVIKDKEEVIGHEIKIKVVKNKMASPFKSVSFEIVFGEGISKTGEIIDHGTEMKIIDKAGAWYSYKGNKMGQGKEQAKQYLKNHPDISKEIESSIRQQLDIRTDTTLLS